MSMIIVRYFVALFFTVLILFAAVSVSGGGHGWLAGACGLLCLAPITFLSVLNAQHKTPSKTKARYLLFFGVLVCLGTLMTTYLEGFHSFFKVFENTDIGMIVIFSCICLVWVYVNIDVISGS